MASPLPAPSSPLPEGAENVQPAEELKVPKKRANIIKVSP